MENLKSVLLKIANLLLFIIVLYIITPYVSLSKADDFLSVFGTAMALFSETLCFIILFRKFEININLLQLLWVFITCTTFYFYFINDFLWDTFLLSKLNNQTIVIFEILVSITEGIILFFIMKLKVLKRRENKTVSFLRCMSYSFIFNTISTLFGYFISPIFIKFGLHYIV